MNPLTCPAPPAVDALLAAALRTWDARFNPALHLVGGPAISPGYHTRIPQDQVAHGTKDNAEYAHLLLRRGQPGDVLRAQGILDRRLDLQVTDTASIHDGIWGWYAEEPPAAMAPADWNWADFLGARLLEILVAHEDHLAPGQSARVRTALRHASAAIVRRDIGPGYTNICAMGAAVCLGVGRVLDDPALVAYGRRRIAAQRAACDTNGGVPEYNSPHYSTILIQELERLLRLSDDAEARDHAEWLRRRMWTLLAEQFHPSTGQWAGAQGRVYHHLLRPHHALFLWQRTGVPPRGAPAMTFLAGPDDLAEPTPCPPEVRARFLALPADPYEFDQTWMPATAQDPAKVLRTWFSRDATLGSIGTSTTWVQHRPITGYWSVPGGVASLRFHLLKDGRDFASGRLRTEQQGPRLHTRLDLVPDQGDWHCSLDRPEDGAFTIRDLRLRVSLEAPDALIQDRTISSAALTAGAYRVVIQPGAAPDDGKPVTWDIGIHNGGVHLDIVLYHGGPRRFDLREVTDINAEVSLELCSCEAVPSGRYVDRRWS